MARFGHLNPYDLHKRLINEYVLKRAGDTALLNARDASRDKTDADVLRENHKFLWDDAAAADSWEQQLAKRYYDKLFKEYCICDLSRYRDNKVALRWRTAAEVVSGKGQFICGCKTCTIPEELRSWEVNFVYVEHEERKNALIKLRLCPDCSTKLNYRSKKREVKKLKKLAKMKPHKRSKHRSTSDNESDSDKTDKTEPDQGESSRNIETHRSDDSDTADPADTIAVPSETNADESADGNWSKKQSNVEEKSREDEFDEYLEDLLL